MFTCFSMTVLCIWERSLKQQQQKTKTLPHTFGKALRFYPKLFPSDLVYEGSLVWEEKQGIFGEKMVQEGWHQNPIQAITSTGEKNIFIMHGNGGGVRLASLYWHIILRERN